MCFGLFTRCEDLMSERVAICMSQKDIAILLINHRWNDDDDDDWTSINCHGLEWIIIYKAAQPIDQTNTNPNQWNIQYNRRVHKTLHTINSTFVDFVCRYGEGRGATDRDNRYGLRNGKTVLCGGMNQILSMRTICRPNRRCLIIHSIYLCIDNECYDMYRLDSPSATFYASSFSVWFSFVSPLIFNSVKVMVKIGFVCTYRFDCEFISIDRFRATTALWCAACVFDSSFTFNF